MNSLPNHPKGISYAVVTALMWGVLAIALKVMLNYLDPASITFARFSIAFVFLFIYQLIYFPESLRIFLKPPLLLIAASVFLAYNYYGFIEGLQHSTPVSSQVFIQVGPVFFALGGIFIYKEKVTRRHIAGFIILLAGLAIYYADQINGMNGNAREFGKGILWIISGGLSWSIYALLQKRLLKDYKASDLNLFIYGFCALLFIPFCNFHATSHLTNVATANLLFLGLNTLIAYNCFALAMNYTDANKISVIVTLNPVLTFILMYLLGVFQVGWIKHEHFTVMNVTGALVALLGVLHVILMPGKLK